MKINYWKPARRRAWPIKPASRWFIRFARLAFGAYKKFVLKVDKILFRDLEKFFVEYESARKGKSRFIMAFRHPGDVDTHVLYAGFTVLIRSQARKRGIRKMIFPVFLAGADISLWLDAFGNFILRKTGSIPVIHGLPFKTSMDAIISRIVESPDPVILAPEGQVTYHCGKVAELDPGIFNLAYMAREKAPEGTKISVLPLSVEYDFGADTVKNRKRLDKELRKLARHAGIGLPADESFRKKLLRVWEGLVDTAENYYAKDYRAKFDKTSGLGARHAALTEVLISLAERSFGLTSAGTPIDRIFVLRTHIFQTISGTMAEADSALTEILKKRKAAECWFIDRHQELADLLVHMDPAYLGEDSSFSRHVEVLLNLCDFANRLGGGTIGQRPVSFRRSITIRVSDPVPLPEGNRREAAREGLTALKKSFDQVAKEYL